MLNGIKAMINEKKNFQEAAEVIFEDASGANLDDLIVLGEDTDLPEPDDDNDTDNDDVKNEPEDNSSNDDIIPEDNSKNDNNDSSNNDIIDTPITNNEGDGLEEPLPIPGDDTLPTPVGKQTGEPITDTDDILNVSIDLKSNTVSDVLPVPPSNAGEAIASDDILSQKIDSGFGNEEPVSDQPESDDDLLNENIEDGSYTEANKRIIKKWEKKLNDNEDVSKRLGIAMSGYLDGDPNLTKDMLEEYFKKHKLRVDKNGYVFDDDGYNYGHISQLTYKDIKDKEKFVHQTNLETSRKRKLKNESSEIENDLLTDNIFQEAITLDGEGKSDSGDEGGEGNSDLPDNGSSDEGGSEGEENSVTKQVRDKVEESETNEEPPLDDTSSNDSNKGDLLKDLSNKLGNITKSLEDAKKVVNSL